MRPVLVLLPLLVAGCAVPGTCVGIDLWGAVCPTHLAGVGAVAAYDAAWNATRIEEGLRALGLQPIAGRSVVHASGGDLEAEAGPRGDGWRLWILARVAPERVPDREVQARADALWETRRGEVEAAFDVFEATTGYRNSGIERQDQLAVV